MGTINKAIFHNDPADPLYGTTTTEAITVPDVTKALQASEFDEFAAGQLGGGDTGRVRLINVLDAGRQAGGLATYWTKQYDRADWITKDTAATLFAALVAANCAEAAESKAISDNWPLVGLGA